MRAACSLLIFLKTMLHSREAEDTHGLGQGTIYTFPSMFILISISTLPCVATYED